MVWLHTFPAFLLWLAYAWAIRRRMYGSRWLRSWPRGARTAASIGAVLLSLAVLAVGWQILASQEWVRPEGLSPGGLAVITLMGLAFVHLQMLATALTLSLVTNAETGLPAAASNHGTIESRKEGGA